MTVLENLMVGRYLHGKAGLSGKRCGRRGWRRGGAAPRLEQMIDLLHVAAIATPVSDLPYGVQKRVELGRALAQDPHSSSSTSRWRE